MATKIKRSLFVGLGGTGMSALLNAKRMFIETYGEVPPMVGFLGIDTDGGAYKKVLDSKNGPVRLDPFEQFSIQVKEPKPYYIHNTDHFSWLPSQNLFALKAMTLGAGQVRTNGRFAVVYNYNNLATQVRTVINRITNAQISNNPKYEIASSQIEVHIVFSVCGGTGCGTFLDVAYLLRGILPNHSITGYAVLPDVFVSMGKGNASMARVRPNAYGAIQDLDWLMHLDMDSRKISLDYISVPVVETNDNPFNTVYFVDNRNENGDVYDHVDQLTDMISLALVTSAGELSSAAASVTDNVQKMIAAGTMDVENKRAWCAGMGVCEILFRGSELRALYARKAVKRIIERLFNSCVDSDTIVNNWIDSVKIRENGGDEHNDVIDFLLDLNAPYQLSDIDNKADAKPEINNYINGAGMTGQDKIEGRVNDLKTKVFASLHELVIKTINQECGIGATEAVLAGIQSQVNIFLEEMNSEYKILQDTLPGLESAKDNAIHDLTEHMGKFFKKASTTNELSQEVMTAAQRICSNRRDALRHSHAISFFTSLKQEIAEEQLRVLNIKRILTSVNEDCTDTIARVKNQVNRESHIFQIDLAKAFVDKVAVADDDILITDLLKELSGDKVYDFETKKSDEVLAALMQYASNVKAAKSWENTTIDNILDRMDEDSFAQIITMAINKSKPLIQYNHQGQPPRVAPTDAYYIGVPDKLNSRLYKDNYFENQLTSHAATVDFANIGNKDRVIIYRQFGVFPAFHIDTLKSYKAEYDSSNVSCHFDEVLHTRMIREQYKLEPTGADKTLPLSLWVQGFIFGLIKNEDGMYMYKNEEEGSSLDKYWMELTPYRDDSFNEFKKHIAAIKDKYEAVVAATAKEKGSAYMEELKKDVKENYLENYSQVYMDVSELKARGNERVRQLVTEELDFVNNNL